MENGKGGVAAQSWVLRYDKVNLPVPTADIGLVRESRLSARLQGFKNL